MADADCFYPPRWIERMTTELQRDGVACIYGNYRFIASKGKARIKYAFYELLRNLIAEVRDVNRPWLNARGMCMGYVKELGLQIGFVDKKIRGEDGRMCFELAQRGKITRVRSREAVVWTFPRTLEKDGSLFHSILNRVLIEVARFRLYFTKEVAHDTHTSPNFEPPTLKYLHKPKPTPGEKEIAE